LTGSFQHQQVCVESIWTTYIAYTATQEAT